MQAALSNVLGVTAVAHLRTRFLVPALRVLLSNSASAYSAGETTAATETSQAPPSLDERSVQRNQFVSELSRLRKQWAEENAVRKQKREAAEAAQRQTVLAKKRAKQLQLQVKKREQAAERAQEEHFARILQAAKAKQGQVWRDATAAVYEQELEGRVLSLMTESRHWIRAQDLDARINEALDNPVDLFQDEEDLYLADSEDEQLAAVQARPEQPLSRPRPPNRLQPNQEAERVW